MTRSLVRTAMAAALAGALLASAGCYEERVVGTSFGVIRPAPEASAESATFAGLTEQTPGKSGFAIALDKVEGPGHQQQAEARRTQIAAQARAKDVWTSEEGDATIIFYGHYDSPDDPAVKQDLLRWRQLIHANQVSAPAAILSPVNVIPEGKNPEADLKRAHGRGIYTLQIAVFDETQPDFRRKAEDAAAALRKQGHDAYYFHGPNRSMITVGMFGEADIVSTPRGQNYSPRVQSLRQVFPYNTLNAVQPAAPAGGARPQASLLVRVP